MVSMQIFRRKTRTLVVKAATHQGAFWLVGSLYVVMFGLIAICSYLWPAYEMHGLGLLTGISCLGIATTILWRQQTITKLHYILPVALILVALTCYPDTSRDAFRYLFDGEMIRLWHLSPYTNLPMNLPVDQYSAIFRQAWWVRIPSPYGPLWQALMVGINFVSSNRLGIGLVLLKLVNLMGLLMCARYIYLITKKEWLSFSFLINPTILIDTVHSPHPDIVIAAALVAAYYYSNMVARGLLVSGSALIKIHGLIFAPFFARSWRQFWLVAGVMSLSLPIMLIILRQLVGFDWMAMLAANQDGGVLGGYSLLFYSLLPGSDWGAIILASYALFLGAYGWLLIAYARKRVSQLMGLTLASLLVPLTLTGLLYPWHFIIPLVFLFLNETPLAGAMVLFIALIGFYAPLRVLTFVVAAALFVAGWYILRWAYPQMTHRPRLLAWLAKAYQSLYA